MRVACAVLFLSFAVPAGAQGVLTLREGEFTLSWSEAAKIDWGTILLFGGGLTLGTLMFETGVARAMGDAFAAQLGTSSLWGFTFAAILIGIIMSETTSNTAAANMVVPVVIAIAQASDINPIPPAAACWASCVTRPWASRSAARSRSAKPSSAAKWWRCR